LPGYTLLSKFVLTIDYYNGILALETP